jgi:hypothetical protein
VKKPFWLIPLSGLAVLILGLTLAAPQAAGAACIVLGAIGTFIGIGVWADSCN